MTPLPAALVGRIADHVAAAGLSGPLAEELTDHLCCLTEDAIATGQRPEDALSATLSTWPADRLRSINRRTNYPAKIKSMLYKIVPFAAVCSGLIFLSPSKADQVTVHPCTTTPETYVTYTSDLDPPTGSPIPGIDFEAALSSGFGMRMHPIKKIRMLHKGIDLKAREGTPVVATADGTIAFAGEDGLNGIMVSIRHADGYSTAYKHLQKTTVKAGDVVSAGQLIGAVGTTGASTAPHLHYEVLKNDKPVNPLAILD